jgi:hypothetical protein
MIDPVTTAIAVALVTKAADGLSEAGKAAFAALSKLVRRKLADGAASRAVLVRAEAQPADDAGRQALAETLGRAAAEDPTFAEELRRLWQRVQEERVGSSNSMVVNSVSGDVHGAVVQARDIQGGISFGQPLAE